MTNNTHMEKEMVKQQPAINCWSMPTATYFDNRNGGLFRK